MAASAAALPVMNIHLNGELRELTTVLTLPELLDSLRLPVSAVLVELNGRALIRSELATATVADGDRVEILRVVAGG